MKKTGNRGSMNHLSKDYKSFKRTRTGDSKVNFGETDMVSILLKKWFPQKFISFLSSFCSFSLFLYNLSITNSPLSKFINSWNMRVVFLNSIHLEVASFPFCLLINSSWLLVFILYLFFLLESIFNLYCWKGIHFS